MARAVPTLRTRLKYFLLSLASFVYHLLGYKSAEVIPTAYFSQYTQRQ